MLSAWCAGCSPPIPCVVAKNGVFEARELTIGENVMAAVVIPPKQGLRHQVCPSKKFACAFCSALGGLVVALKLLLQRRKDF